MDNGNKYSFFPQENRDFKFVNLANDIVQYIRDCGLKPGEKIPSVREICGKFNVTRNTAVRSLRFLREKNITRGVPGKGSYLRSFDPHCNGKVLCIFNNMTDYKDMVFDSIRRNLGKEYRLDLTVFNYNYDSFAKIVDDNIGSYDQYVVMPFFQDEEKIAPKILDTMSQIPLDQLILIDKYPSFLSKEIAAVYQDFSADLSTALTSSRLQWDKYKRLSLVVPDVEFTSPGEIVTSFVRFCESRNLPFRIGKVRQVIESGMKDEGLIVLSEPDLVEILKQVKQERLAMGEDVGIISYNDHPFKALMNISTLSTNFAAMGSTVSYMINHHKRESVKNEFYFQDRGSA